MANTPNVTEPVSRKQVASLGVTMNLGSAGQGAVGGGSNGSIGGSVSQGALSFQQAAVNPSTVLKNAAAGASSENVTSSQNILAIQKDSTDRVASEYVVRTSNVVSTDSERYASNLPVSDKVAELPALGAGLGAVRTSASRQVGTVYPNGKGIEDSTLYGSVTNLEAIYQVEKELSGVPAAGHIDSGISEGTTPGKQIGDPTAQFRQNNVQGQASVDYPKI